jgi:hypothetical protein
MTTAILIISGIICLLASGVMLYKLAPRDGQNAPWMKSDSLGTAMSLGQFALMVAGLALLAKAIF